MKQAALWFQSIENFHLLYDEVFKKLIDWSYTDLQFPEANDTVVQQFLAIMSHRDAMLTYSTTGATNEEEYRQKLITPLLTQILGYSLSWLRPEQTVKEFWRIDDLYEWNDRTLPIEAKQYGRLQWDRLQVRKRTNADPIYQITTYLNGLNYKLYERKLTHLDAPYAILTDGLERRLYAKSKLTNQSHPACLIVRLDQINLDDLNQVKESLWQLLLFFSEASTRREWLLDQIFAENEVRALKIKDQLWKQVYDAVEYIANGIYLKIRKRPEDKKQAVVGYYKLHFSWYEDDKQARLMKVLYHESLVYLFRIIFGLYAEDRNLLEAVNIKYGLKSWEYNLLSDLKRKFQNTHGGDDWTSNEYTYQFTQNEDVHLEKWYFWPINKKYNGWLFDPERHPLLAEFDINDRYFLRAVDYLMRTRDPDHKGQLATISYAQLDVRHLGTIYENLLEFALVPNQWDDAAILPLQVANDKGERKSTWSYYTPDYIVAYIVQQTVGAKVDEIVAWGGSTHEQCDQILSLTICDPAMGSWHFLIEVIEYLHTRIQELISTLPDQQQWDYESRYTKSQIASHCVYGVDINYLAVELAKVVMWIKTFEEETPLQFLDANLKWWNSLIGTHIDQMFESDKMKQIDGMLSGNLDMMSIKARQSIQEVTQLINEYITGASDGSLSMDEQKKQIKLKETLYEFLSYRYFDQAEKLSRLLGDELQIEVSSWENPYKVRSKAKRAHVKHQREDLQEKYGDLNPVSSYEELIRLYQIGIAAYNARYMLTVPLALEFIENSRSAISSSYTSQINSMLGWTKTKEFNPNAIHLPKTASREYEHGITIQQAVDQVIQDINPFHRELEFPTVFAKGGFDCVVGNPPYLRIQWMRNFSSIIADYYENIYESATRKYDLYTLFMEQSYYLLNDSGVTSFILPHKFLTANFWIWIRSFLSLKKYINTIIHFWHNLVFKEANTYTCISSFSKKSSGILNFKYLDPVNLKNSKISSYEKMLYDNIDDKPWILLTETETKVFSKINRESFTSIKLASRWIYQWVVSTWNDIFMMEWKVINDFFEWYSNALSKTVVLEKWIMKAILQWKDIQRYSWQNVSQYIIYPHTIVDWKTQVIEENILKNKYPKTYLYLQEFKNDLIRKKVKYKTNPKYRYSLHRSRELNIFNTNSVITPQLQNYPNFTLNINWFLTDAWWYVLDSKHNHSWKFLLSILNSKLFWFFIKKTSSEYWWWYFYFKTKYIEPFKFPKIIFSDQQPFIDAADTMLELHAQQHDLISQYHQLLTDKYDIPKRSRKLEKFWELDFKQFYTELTKKNKVLKNLDDIKTMNLRSGFETQSQKIQDYQNQIDAMDEKIDEMVFDLYELTEEEREVVREG